MKTDTTLAARPCPSDDQLLEFLEGAAPEQIADHVEKCGRCLGRLEQLAQPSTRVLDAARLAEAVLETEGEPAPHHPDYEVLGDRPVAQGGMGVLWLVRDRRHNRRLAMKVLSSRWVTSADMRARFRDETVLACQLMHTGLIPIYDDGFLPPPDERPFYVMRFIRSATNDSAPGETLEARLPVGPCPPAQLVSLLENVRDVARTLGYLHLHDVIHRDVKPQNILLGPQQEAFLLDLGLAKKLAVADKPGIQRIGRGTTITPRQGDLLRTQSSHGTPGYMPPEQARNEVAEITQRSDVFSLGVILARILTGQGVFAGTDSRTILGNTLAGNTSEAVARVKASGADPALTALTLQCIEVAPAARPADGNAVAQSLASYLASLEAKRRQAFVRRAVLRTTTVGALVVMAVSLAAALGLWSLNRSLQTTNSELVDARQTAEENEKTAVKNEKTARQNEQTAKDNAKLAEDQRLLAQTAAGRAMRLVISRGIPDGSEADKVRSVFLESAAVFENSRFALELGMAGFNQIAPPPESSIKLPAASILHVSLSPDEKWALVSFVGGAVELYDLETGARTVLPRKHEDMVFSHTFSPDGRLFATGGGDGRLVIWDFETRTAQHQIEAHLREVTALTFTSDSQRVISADGSVGQRQGPLLLKMSGQPARVAPTIASRLVVTDATSGEQVTAIRRAGSSGISLAVSPDNQLVLCGTDAGVVETFNLQQQTLKRATPVEIGGVQAIGFASHAQAWLMGTAGLAVLDIETGKHRSEAARVAEGAGAHMRGTLSKNCQYALATYRDGTARMYEIARKDRTLTLVGLGDGTRLGPIAAGRAYAVLTADGYLWRYPLASAFTGVPLIGSDDDIEHWAICEQRPWIVGGTDDGQVIVWDQHTGQILLQVHAGNANIRSNPAITADGKYLAAAADERVRIWTLSAAAEVTATRDVATTLQGIRTLAVDHQGQRLAAGDEQGAVNLIDLAPGSVSGTVPALPLENRNVAPVFELQFSPNDQVLLIYSSQTRLWDVRAGKLRTTLPAAGVEGSAGSEFQFSADGTRVVSSRFGDSIQRDFVVWDAGTGELQATLRTAAVGGTNPLLVRFVSSDQQLLAVGTNGKLRLFELATQEEILQVMLGSPPLRGAAADTTCGRIVLQGHEGSARVFHLDPKAWTGGFALNQPNALRTQLLHGARLPREDAALVRAQPQPDSTSPSAAAPDSGAVQAIAVPGNDCQLTSDGNLFWLSGTAHAVFELSLGESIRTRMLPGISVGPLPGWPKRGLLVGRTTDHNIMLLRDERIGQGPVHTFPLGTQQPLKIWDTGQQSDRLAAGFLDGTVIGWTVTEDQGSEIGRYTLPAAAREAAMALTPAKAEWFARLREIRQPIFFPVEALAVSPNGQLIITGHSTLDRGPTAGIVAVYDIEAKNMLGWQALPEGAVTAVALLEGDRVAAGQWNGSLHVLQLDFDGLKTELKIEQDWPAHEGMIRAVVGTADGQRLISAGNDRTAKIWDRSNTDKPLRVLNHPASVLDLALSEDEKQLVTVCADGFVRVFDLD